MTDNGTPFNSLSASFVEGLYADYLHDPTSVADDWRRYFEGIAADAGGSTRVAPALARYSIFNPPGNGLAAGAAASGPASVRGVDMAILQDRMDQLIRAYRVRGHMVAALDPLGLPRPQPPELDPEFYGFTEADMDLEFSTRTIKGPERRTVRHILDVLRNTYCRRIGVQFMHIDTASVRQWLQDRMEGSENRLALEREEQLRILTRLIDASIFEEFLQKSFLGSKSFSLEGAESLIPLLDLAFERAAEQGVCEVVIGMAHRGRLNVLANIMAKSPQQIFREFADLDPELHIGRGDVKYHLGHSTDWTTSTGKKLHLSLCFNPSHLEFVDPVAIGRMRAKQDRIGDTEREQGMVVLIHGDAAFAGEGIIQEVLNLSELRGYSTGGTIHVVVNNQIGFTTPPSDARSCAYATDVAKMLQSPIFHVNGEDPEAVAQVVQLAVDFRRMFKRDVVIDMYCYRRRGHNEGDEPAFTQPVLYRAIENRKSVREGYLEHLLAMGGVTREEADRIAERRRAQLAADLSVAKSADYRPRSESPIGIWKGFFGGPAASADEVDTRFDRARLSSLLASLSKVPADFHVHPKLKRQLDARHDMADGKRALDWAAGENLAFASLSVEGHRVRLSGQDAARGTFSHRHAIVHDIEDGRQYMALAHLAPTQAPVEIYNSPLSEAGVLGFEYGYSLDWPDGLVMWEAQFGDFVNAAQVIIDQFIVSAEDKWRRLSGLVMLLPHGFEGMGPEHSSARLERFLTLAAEDNIQVASPTTPAQYFHLLRQQVKRRWRKPLVVMTPKSLLRHPQVVSSLEDLASGSFQPVVHDAIVRTNRTRVDRILLCTGKVYYDLDERRRQLGRDDVAILRMEQLYPLPSDELREALTSFAEAPPVVWVQEEPDNMGAWRFIRHMLGDRLFDRFQLSGITRPASSSPATGSHSSHKLEQEELLSRAFGELPSRQTRASAREKLVETAS